MKNYTYIGYFVFGTKTIEIEVHAMGYISAYHLVMAKAINKALDYTALERIEKIERGFTKEVKTTEEIVKSLTSVFV